MFCLKRKSSTERSIKYIARYFVNLSKSGSKFIGITSSGNNKELQFFLCRKICKEILYFNSSVALVDADRNTLPENSNFKIISTNTDKVDNEVIMKILELKNKYDIVLFNVSSVLSNISSLDYLKTCDKVFSAERCMYTYYSDFENTLNKLKNNNMELSGILTFS